MDDFGNKQQAIGMGKKVSFRIMDFSPK
jgi:hypothetical protein